tara:strand:- start:103 stop:381 length:279 start_codon:yes stop_codon:yes gene_type:complete
MKTSIYIERQKLGKRKDQFVIRQLENAISIQLNKMAKQEDGEGPQVECGVGDTITKEQAEQACRISKVTVTEAQDNSFESFLGIKSEKPNHE